MTNELNALAERVAALERTVALLQAQIGSQNGNWVRDPRWAVSDEEAFEEVIRLGREFRDSYRVDDEADSQP